MLKRAIPAALVASALLVGAAAAQPGSDEAGLGDPFFPGAGNGGYEVGHYDIRLDYAPPPRRGGAGRLRSSSVVIDATALRRLPSFNLDLIGLRVESVRVGGRRASFERDGSELRIVPLVALAAGQRFTATVRYRGRPRPITDPDGSEEGWFPTASGGAVAVGEPLGTASWLPCNNHPSDKATFSFRIAVPAARDPLLRAVANGRLAGVAARGGQAVWHWVERQPMAAYLATVAIDDFEISKRRAGRVPAWFALDSAWLRKGAGVRALLRRGMRAVPSIQRFLGSFFGPYPFGSTGATVVGGPGAGLDYALETQTRPTYPTPPTRNMIVHELAHQWFGNSVTPSSWADIWLNEGFATFSEWLYRERHGGPSARAVYRSLLRRPADESFWSPPPGRIGGPEHLFAGSVYVRGAMTLEALRLEVGDRVFFALLREWATANRYGNVDTAGFIALAERRAGRPLDRLFQRWLYEPGKSGLAEGPTARAPASRRR